MRNSIPDPELRKQMRHISNVNLTIDSKFTSQGQLLLIDPQEDMVSVHHEPMFISFKTLCSASNPDYILASFFAMEWPACAFGWTARKDYMREKSPYFLAL